MGLNISLQAQLGSNLCCPMSITFRFLRACKPLVLNNTHTAVLHGRGIHGPVHDYLQRLRVHAERE